MGNLCSKEKNKIINSKIFINITTPNYIYNDIDLSYNVNHNSHIDNTNRNDTYRDDKY